MLLKVKNCNNVQYAEFEICENKLNIKLAPNGTGKSTIAKAILLSNTDEPKMKEELMPFVLRESNPSNLSPEIEGINPNLKIMCYNEDYVRQFNFQKDELLSNSFEILIRTDTYNQLETDIENLVSSTKTFFSNNPEIESLIQTLKELGAAFKITKTGISKASPGMKGLSGNKINHVPTELESFRSFIESKNCVEWIDWQTKGCSFVNISDHCPFCTSNITDKNEQINKVGQVYNKNHVKNLLEIIDIISRLGDYLSDDAKTRLREMTLLENGISQEHESYIFRIRILIDDFIQKLEDIKKLSGFDFKENEKVPEKLQSLKLSLSFFPELDSIRMRQAIDQINESIDKVVNDAGELQGKVNVQRIEVNRLITRHQENINYFLEYAGFKYQVNIDGEGNNLKLKLRHVEYSQHLSGGDQYLSFGEKNAFSIVLFMHECLSINPDIIILDDPISSFDKNKKFAIFEMLFLQKKSRCLKNKTVLMFTHDIEPIIDTIKSLHNLFQNLVAASFLNLSNGTITEHTICKRDIITFTEICTNVINGQKNDIIKLIYLRRYYEIIDDKGDSYQVLSNLLHKRVKAIDYRESTENNQKPEMNSEKFLNGCAEINKKLKVAFTYESMLAQLTNKENIIDLYNNSDNRYEKLQLFRLLESEPGNPVVKKFINETYHIENEYIYQLDPSKFETVPEYIIVKCDEILKNG